MEPSSSSRSADASGGDPGNGINASGPLLSIRCRNKNPPEIVDMDMGKPDSEKRGIVTVTKHRGLRNAARRAKQRGGARVPRVSAEVASMQEKLDAVQQEMADLKDAYQQEMADLKATVRQLLAAQSNQMGDPVVVAASPNVPSKSSHASNDDLDDDGDNDNDLVC